MASAIRHAAAGFTVTPYLADCIAECAADLGNDAEIARLFLPDGDPIPAGARLVQGDYAETLRAIARDGPDSLYGGSVGRAVADHMARAGGLITLDDLRAYRTVERQPVRGTYRGFEIVGPPPPSSGGVHVIQMLNILEGFDIAALGFGSAEALHLIAESLKIAFADRAVATADPDFVDVPVARLIDKAYAAERRGQLDRTRAQSWTAAVAKPVAAPESPNTTHVTVVDADRAIVTSTQTIHSLFGARYVIAGTGMIANNYMSLFDPRPGRVQSIVPGKRTTTSQAPIIALRSGRPVYALGLPGGLRIFGAAMQALVNLVDHGMSLQEAVEAPRLWTQGQTVEIEDGFPAAVRDGLAALGHGVVAVAHVGGGMTAVRLDQDGLIHGAACWRADGMPMAVGGGLARTGARFWPDQAVPPSRDPPV